VLVVKMLYFNAICKKEDTKADSNQPAKEDDDDDDDKQTNNVPEQPDKNLLPYQTVTQKVQVMFDKALRFDTLPIKRRTHLNCEHRKAPGNCDIGTCDYNCEIFAHRRCADTTKKPTPSRY
jgi:hypothetical protein